MNRLRRFSTENIGLKLLSLGFAVLLWVLVGGDVQSEIVVPVTVEFRNVPPGMDFEAEPTRVEVRVRGFRREVRRTSSADFSVPVDLSSMEHVGIRTVSLEPGQVEAPVSMQVVAVTPSQITIITKGEM
jgi:hypothetical protein